MNARTSSDRRCVPGPPAVPCATIRPSCSITSSSPSRCALGMLCVTMISVVVPSLLQAEQQIVDFVGGDRIEPGARLVDEQHRRIERQRAREAGALPHAARQIGRHLVVFRARARPTPASPAPARGSRRPTAWCGGASETRRSRRPRSSRTAPRSGTESPICLPHARELRALRAR